MNKLVKLGYFLMGIGVGMFISTILYERELEKPIGDVEEYIPPEDLESEEPEEYEVAEIVEEKKLDSDDRISNFYDGFDKSRHPNRNQRTRYSNMYNSNEQPNEPRKKSDTADKDIYTDFSEYDEELEDGPQDDEVDIVAEDSLLVRERVEENIEVYLDDNPEDYITLNFYEGDNTLTDDQERIVPAADEVVGLAALDRLLTGGPGAEEGSIFIRNLRTMTNYEVVLYQGSYSETVLGIIEGRPNEGAGGDVHRRE